MIEVAKLLISRQKAHQKVGDIQSANKDIYYLKKYFSDEYSKDLELIEEKG